MRLAFIYEQEQRMECSRGCQRPYILLSCRRYVLRNMLYYAYAYAICSRLLIYEYTNKQLVTYT